MFKKPIISDFFTTISWKQFLYSFAYLTYKIPFLIYGKNNKILKNNILKYLNKTDSKVELFYNGRSAIYYCIKILKLNKNDEIIINGYNCITVSNAIIQAGIKPIYSDITKKDLSFDIKKLEQNINKNTKVILVQHTFGKASSIEKIKEICLKNNIILIEDVAHALGTEYNGKKLGTFGDFAIFSTGRDKVISSVTGGILVCNNNKYFNDFEKINNKLKNPSILLTIRNHFYNIIAIKAYYTYNIFGLGKIIIYISRKLGLITEILTLSEKKCNYKKFGYKLPNSLAYLGIKELEKLDKYNKHRIKIANFYNKNIVKKLICVDTKNNIYFRYPILCESIKQKEKLYRICKKNNILLGVSWSGTNIAPVGSNTKKAKYIKGSCRESEDISNRLLTLANHQYITLDDAKTIIDIINKNV